MIRVGVVGLGMMGLTHLEAYARRADCRVVAVSDSSAERLAGQLHAHGNIPGQAEGGIVAGTRRYSAAMDLINAADVDLVDICLPTHLHLEHALAGLAAGKHVLVEKPLARTHAQALELVRAARNARGFCMAAMCLRFWPGWTWLKQAVERQTYGPALAVHFRRLASHPGGAFYSAGRLCGGAALDLHIHDTDMAHWLFGVPDAVSTLGYTSISGELDHLLTQYHYPNGPMVSAEGAWDMAPGFPFHMHYMANFERATAVYDFPSQEPLRLAEGGTIRPVVLEAGMGYEHEIGYFLDCIAAGRRPERVTLEAAAETIRIVEAEVKSARDGRLVALR